MPSCRLISAMILFSAIGMLQGASSADDRVANLRSGPGRDQLQKLMEELSPDLTPVEGEDLHRRLKRLTETVCHAADAIAMREDATEAQKSKACLAKLHALSLAANTNPRAFRDQFRAYADRLLKESPHCEAAFQAKVIELRERIVDATPTGTIAVHLANAFGLRIPTGAPNPNAYRPILSDLDALARSELDRHSILGEHYLTFAERLDWESRERESLEVLEHARAVLSVRQAGIETKWRQLAAIGQPMQLSGKTITGEPFQIQSLRGKVVLIDFWATWCGPCIDKMKDIRKLYDQFHDEGFEVVGVSLDADSSEVEDFQKKESYPWLQLLDSESRSGDHRPTHQYGVSSIPVIFLVDRDGNVAARIVRGAPLEPVVRRLLQQPTRSSMPSPQRSHR